MEKMDLELTVTPFDRLTPEELYEILRLRVNVFVVEQRCPYPELDGRDKTALHVCLKNAEGIQAYLRIMDRDETHPYVTIGRVIAVPRRSGVGSRLLAEGIRLARERCQARQIYLEAQTYARSFYERQGFRQISPEFLEDGIPHIQMLLDFGQEPEAQSD